MKLREAARSAAADYGMQLRQTMMAPKGQEDPALAIADLQRDMSTLRATSSGLQAEMSQVRKEDAADDC